MYTVRANWNREELFEEVWATPMRTLASKYGISDVGLAKICRKLSIPLPGLGYWAKIAAGQKIKKATLPAVKKELLLAKPAPRAQPPKLEGSSTDQERAQVEKLE